MEKPRTGNLAAVAGSNENLNMAAESDVSYICHKFVEDYAETFARDFHGFYKKATPGDSLVESISVSSVELYQLLFPQNAYHSFSRELRHALREVVRHTYEAERILSNTCFIMVKSLIDCLLKHNGSLRNLESVVTRIHNIMDLLHEIYYEESRKVTVKPPGIDLESDSYKEILGTFNSYIIKRKEEKKLYKTLISTYYRSIPMELKAKVIKVKNDYVSFKVHPYEAVALYRLGMAFINSPLHKTVFRAYAKRVNIKKRIVRFSHFIPQDGAFERRTYVRVEPKTHVRVKIVTEKEMIEGIISDISETDVSVYFRNINIEEYPEGLEVRITSELPNVYEKDFTSINSIGSIIKLYKSVHGDHNASKIVVRFDPSHILRPRLAQYVSERQVEIMQELNELCSEEE